MRLFFIVAIVASFACLGLAQEGEGGAEAKDLEDNAAKLAAGSSDDSDWVKEVTKLNSKQDEIKQHEQTIENLVKAKQMAKTRAEKQTVIKQLVEVHENLKKAVREYNRIQPKIQYRYPARGKKVQRRYLPIKIKSIEQMENEMGLDSDLTRVRRLVQQKYSPFVKKETKIERHTAGEFTQKEADEAVTTQRIKLKVD